MGHVDAQFRVRSTGSHLTKNRKASGDRRQKSEVRIQTKDERRGGDVGVRCEG